MIISDSRKISAIQEEFNTSFPYLKLEFFEKPHKPGGFSLPNSLRQFSKTLGEYRMNRNAKRINIVPSMTVTELEQGFKEVYGLGVQVFRKSGKLWLETTVTDGWTLEEQNKQGEELSK